MKKIFAFFLAICLILPLGIAFDAAPAMAAVGDNLISNSGFDGGSLQGWTSRITDEPYVKTAQDASGNYYAYIFDKYDAFLQWYDEPIIPGMDYELRFKARWEGSTSTQGIGYKFQNNVQDMHGKITTTIGDKAEWQEFTIPYRAPIDSTKVDILLRHYNTGTVFYDDIQFVQVSEPHYLEMTYADVFSYTDETEGTAEFRLNTKADYTPTKNAYIKLEIENADGEILWTGEKVPVNSDFTAKTTFPTNGMQYIAGETTPYTLVAKLYDTGVNPETSGLATRTIYRYPRPSMLDKDGNIRMKKDGKWEPFNPVAAYHVYLSNQSNPKALSDIDKVGAAGINVVQSCYEHASGILYYLDVAQKHGQKVLASLYLGMKTAGHPENLANTEEAVKLIKDHPALFGYILMDEPYAYFDNPGHYFETAYTLIRKYDTDHVVTLMNDKVAWNKDAAQYVDLMMIDPYISGTQNPASFVAERTELAVSAANGKPILPVVQAYPLGGKEPTADELRSMTAQAIFSGGKGAGYFPIYGYKEETINGVKYRRSLHEIKETWNPMVERKSELDTLMNIFTRRDASKNSTVTDVTNPISGLRKITWYDGDDQYMALLNTKGRGLNKNETSAQYNEAAKNMKISALFGIPNGKVETVIGLSENVSYQNGVLRVNIEYCGVYVLKVEGEIAETLPGFNGEFFDNDMNGQADNWTGTHTAALPTTLPYAGYIGNSIEIPGGKNYIVRHKDKISVSAGDTYILTGYFKGQAKLYCEFTNADGAWGSNQTQLGNAANWQFFSVQITVPSDKGFTDFQIGVRNESAALVSFADLKLRPHTNLIPSLSAWDIDSAYSGAGGTVQTVEGYEGESAIRLDFSKGADWGRTNMTYPKFEPNKAYKITMTYKTEDTECIPVLRLANMYGSNVNTDIAFEQAAYKNSWCQQTVSFVAPDAEYGLKLELKKGSHTPSKTTYVTISDILVEEDKNEVVFPKAAAFKSGATVTVNYHFAEPGSTLSKNAERMIAFAVYKKEEGKTTLLATKIIRTPSWYVPANAKFLHKPFDFEASLTLPMLSEGKYEIKVMTRDESLARPFGTVYSAEYEI